MARLWSQFASCPHPNASRLSVDARAPATPVSEGHHSRLGDVSSRRKAMISIQGGAGYPPAVARRYLKLTDRCRWALPAGVFFHASDIGTDSALVTEVVLNV